jgi:CubicO group peptidase (beta-lactamase class C family)
MNIVHLRSIALRGSFVPLAFITALLLTALATEIPAQDIKAVTPEKVGLSSERLARLDKAMQEEIDQKRKAGIVVLVARRGSIAHFKAFGMADIESGVKMRTDQIFKLYSQTKPVTSVALLMLYEEGRFQLTDPLEKYRPAFCWTAVASLGILAAGVALSQESNQTPAPEVALFEAKTFKSSGGEILPYRPLRLRGG